MEIIQTIVDKANGTQEHSSTMLDNPMTSKIYEEICKSFHAIDDFRMKLLGIVPLTSLTGILALGGNLFIKATTEQEKHTIAFICSFAAVFSFAIFLYELWGIVRCHELTVKGREIENQLGINGQFSTPSEREKGDQAPTKYGLKKALLSLDPTVPICSIYSLVVTAWVFAGLHFGLDIDIPYCFIVGVLIGLLMGVRSWQLLQKALGKAGNATHTAV